MEIIGWCANNAAGQHREEKPSPLEANHIIVQHASVSGVELIQLVLKRKRDVASVSPKKAVMMIVHQLLDVVTTRKQRLQICQFGTVSLQTVDRGLESGVADCFFVGFASPWRCDFDNIRVLWPSPCEVLENGRRIFNFVAAIP